MNYAKLESSERLQRVEQFLSDGLFHSTMEIVNGAKVMAVNSAVAECRNNGLDIRCIRRGRVYFYRLIASMKPKVTPPTALKTRLELMRECGL